MEDLKGFWLGRFSLASEIKEDECGFWAFGLGNQRNHCIFFLFTLFLSLFRFD